MFPISEWLCLPHQTSRVGAANIPQSVAEVQILPLCDHPREHTPGHALQSKASMYRAPRRQVSEAVTPAAQGDSSFSCVYWAFAGLRAGRGSTNHVSGKKTCPSQGEKPVPGG